MTQLDDTQRRAQTQFDQQAARYGRQHILSDTSDVVAALREVEFQPGHLALDVAAGAGHTGLLLAERGWQVTLSDLSTAMLEKVRAAAAERGLNVQTRQHPAEQFPFDDGKFHLVTCRVAAHHFSDPRAFVRESARVLKPGGTLLLIDGSVADGQPEAAAWIHAVEKLRDPSHVRLLTPGECSQHCREAGLLVRSAKLSPFKQPDLEWYFETAATSPANKVAVRELLRTASPAVRDHFRLGNEDGKTVWWWERLTMLADKPVDGS